MPQCVLPVPLDQPIGIAKGSYVYPAGSGFIMLTGGTSNCSGPVLLSQAEITAIDARIASLEASGGGNTPDAALMRETFFMSFGLVIGIWFVGKCVGAVLRLIKGEESEFS